VIDEIYEMKIEIEILNEMMMMKICENDQKHLLDEQMLKNYI
jgi:hypothetical protein